MSLPLELGLTKTDHGLRMTYRPIAELQKLRTKSLVFHSPILTPQSANPISSLNGELVEVVFEASPSSDAIMEWSIRGEKLRYSQSTRFLEGFGLKISIPKSEATLKLRFFVDRNSIEIFAASDQIYVPIPVSFSPENISYSFRILQGEAEQARIDTYELRSAWNKEMRR
jgi:levanase/fructan beta-fructosidase